VKWNRKNVIIASYASLIFVGILCVSVLVPILLNESQNPYDWLLGEPEDFGFDIEKLNLARSFAKNISGLRSVLVIRHGVLVVEWYFHGATCDTALHIHSASKSFISTLIGIAIRNGYISSVNQKMMDFFPEYEYLDLESKKYDITLQDLLSMKAGFAFNESVEAYEEYGSSPNSVKYILKLPLMHDPGEYWHYSTVQSDLLSVILTKASGMSSMTFAQKYLFEPANFTIDHWNKDSQGYYFGGHEMYYTPRAMARFGLMYLNNGTIFGEQIVSEEWFLESIQDHSVGYAVEQFWGGSALEEEGYGYQWWIRRQSGYATYNALGLGGKLFVVFQT
jgi:CubicO group peptidase (beta-lactamase class C family)